MGVLCLVLVLLCCVVLSVLSKFASILLRKRELAALPILLLSYCCVGICVCVSSSWYRRFVSGLSCHTVKPFLSGHSKIDKTKVLKTNGSLMEVKSNCRMLCNTFDLH